MQCQSVAVMVCCGSALWHQHICLLHKQWCRYVLLTLAMFFFQGSLKSFTTAWNNHGLSTAVVYGWSNDNQWWYHTQWHQWYGMPFATKPSTRAKQINCLKALSNRIIWLAEINYSKSSFQYRVAKIDFPWTIWQNRFAKIHYSWVKLE